MSIAAWLNIGTELLLNRVFAADEDSQAEWVALCGKLIAVHLEPLERNIYLLITAGGPVLLQDASSEPDVILYASPLALAKLMVTQDIAILLHSGEIRMQGDTRLGHKLKYLLSLTAVDWEALFAQAVGDNAGYALGRLQRRMRRHLLRVEWGLRMSAGDYLREEARLLPTKIEVDNLLHDIDCARHTAERLQLRLEHLMAAIQKQ